VRPGGAFAVLAALAAAVSLVSAAPACAAPAQAAPAQPPPQAASPFADWSAVVVAGDWHAHSGGPSEAFDNARRDVAQALADAGFARANIRQFSVRPARYRDVQPAKSSPRAIYEALAGLARRNRGGCLAYFSSHGAPDGVVVDDVILPPAVLAAMLDEACGDRPTVVVVSACFSGVFVRPLAGANRMVLTAARPDRTSFGCGEADKYPYFDDCFLQAMSKTPAFPALADFVRACIADREKAEGASPPSEPQVFIGEALRPILPLWRFVDGP
jgi:hypothetical protein